MEERLNKKSQYIDCQRVFLRPATRDDIEDMLDWMRHTDVLKFLHQDITEEYITHLCIQRSGLYAIVLKTNERCIGNIQINVLSKQDVTIGYALNKAYWRQGYMRESLQALLEYLFQECDIWDVVASVHYDNFSSLKVLNSCGFSYIGSTTVQGKLCKSYILINKKKKKSGNKEKRQSS